MSGVMKSLFTSSYPSIQVYTHFINLTFLMATQKICHYGKDVQMAQMYMHMQSMQTQSIEPNDCGWM